MSMKLSSRLRVSAGLINADITTLRSGGFVDASGAQRVMATVLTGPLVAAKTVTAQLLQATDAAGANAKALNAPVVLTAPQAGGAVSGVVEAMPEYLDGVNGFKFIGISLVSNNGAAVQGAAMMTLGDNRYSP